MGELVTWRIQFTNLPTHQLTNSPTHQLTNSPTHQFTNSPTHQFSLSLVWDDVRPLARVRAGDHGDDRVGVARVEHLVRDARLDEDEIAGGVFNGLLQTVAVFVADAAFQNVEHHLEADVDVRVRDAAGRD